LKSEKENRVCAKKDDEYLKTRAGCIRLYLNVCYVVVREERKKDGRELGETLEVVYIWLARLVRADGNATAMRIPNRSQPFRRSIQQMQMHNHVWP